MSQRNARQFNVDSPDDHVWMVDNEDCADDLAVFDSEEDAEAYAAAHDARPVLAPFFGTLPASVDAAALITIARIMSGTEWDAGTMDAVAETVRGTGRTIADVNDDDDSDTNCPHCGYPITDGSGAVVRCEVCGSFCSERGDVTMVDYR